jgi:hypothetical protein
MRLLVAILATLLTSSGWAADAVIKDGGTIQLAGSTYRLDGIDAPELDQVCVDDHADFWACGVEARDRLAKLTARRDVRCRDLGADPTTGKRRTGICTVEGETASLDQMLVREGFALNFEPAARAGSKRTRPQPGTRMRGFGKAVSQHLPNFADGNRRQPCSAPPAEATRIANYARYCFRIKPRCRRAVRSRESLRSAPASPAMSASTICKAAAAMRA